MRYSKEQWMRKESLKFKPGFTAIFVPPTSMRSMGYRKAVQAVAPNGIELRLTGIFSPVSYRMLLLAADIPVCELVFLTQAGIPVPPAMSSWSVDTAEE